MLCPDTPRSLQPAGTNTKEEGKSKTSPLTIDIGGPKIKTCTAGIAKGAGLCANDRGYSLNKSVIEGRTHKDGLGERRRVAELPGR